MFHAWPSFFFFLLKKIYGANNFTRFRRFNSCLNVRGCVSIGQEAFSLERDESTPDWTSHDRLTRNDSTHFHDRRPFRCAPPFLRSLETNTVDSEIVTKETDSFSLLLISRFPLLARFFSINFFFPTVRRIQRDYCSRDDNFVRDAAINSIKTLGARDLAYFSFISFESSLRRGTAREFEEKE